MTNSNLNPFSTPEAVNRYATKTRLFPEEQTIFNKYLTDTSQSVLDLGCGTGRTTRHLRDMGLNVVGVDISEKMIARAKMLHPDIDFRVGDACNLNFQDASFDTVLFSFNGLDCIYPETLRVKAIREIYRVLKPDGLFIFSSHNALWLLLPSRRRLRKVRRYDPPYYLDRTAYGTLIAYFTTRSRQRRQLAENRFTLLETYGSWRKAWIYYVAKKDLTSSNASEHK